MNVQQWGCAQYKKYSPYFSVTEPPMPFLFRFLRKTPNLILFGTGVEFYLEHSSRLEEYWRLYGIGVV